MKKLFSSLRFKIVAYTLAAFTLLLASLFFLIFKTYENSLRSAFDTRLRDGDGIVSESIAVAADALVNPVPQISPFRFPQFYFQIRTADGRVLEKSNNLGTAELPFSNQARDAKERDTAAFETLHGDLSEKLGGSLGLRMLTIYHHADNTAPYYLQIAGSLDFIERSLSELRRTLFIAFFLGIAAAGATSFLIAWQSLASISDIAKQAKELNAARLDRRILGPDSDDEIAYLVHVINGMLDRLQQAFAAQERFIADVSHELRTPLSILLGEAQVLTQQPRSLGDYDKYVGSVQEEMRRLAQVVNSLLTLARAHAGFPLPSVSQLSVNDLVVEAVQRSEQSARQRQIRLVPELAMPESENLEPIIEGDAELLCTMISNLVRNAVRYSYPRGTIEIRVTTTESHSTITVADRGPGLAPEHIGSIFNRFYHVPKNGATGSGLGLAIAKAVVELHHGTIEAQNRMGGGCEFIVSLPQAAPELVGVS